jgi:hypothetical protein
MLTLLVGEVEYNNMLHDILKLSEIMNCIHKTKSDEALHKGLELLSDVRERMLEIVANND